MGVKVGLRVVFFGSPQDAVPALEAVSAAGHEVVAVYTRADSRAGRSRRLHPTPVRAAAEKLAIPVETPRNLREAGVMERLAGYEPEIFVVVAYGRILPPEVLALPRLGAVNIHPSLLPRHRGPSPVSTAILKGDAATGVTVMLLDEGMDTGPLLMQSDPVPLDGTERTGELTARLFEIGATMLPTALERLEDGSISPQPQDEVLATVTRLLQKEDGLIDWNGPAAAIERKTRAYDPWPGAFTTLDGRNLKIVAARVATGTDGIDTQPGRATVIDRRVFVATGDGALELTQVQPEGRRPMSAQDLLNGLHGLDGAIFGE